LHNSSHISIHHLVLFRLVYWNLMLLKDLMWRCPSSTSHTNLRK
jgi:hypothetical protein